MSKRFFSRLLHLRISTCVIIALAILTVCEFFCNYGVYNYTHIPLEDIDNHLYKAVAPKLVKKKHDCRYEQILYTKKRIDSWEVPKKYDSLSVGSLVNGSFVPEDCNPAFSVAVLVTYRNRQSQLDVFLPYMHNFLRKQNIHYKIYLIEQQDEKPWNKGLLYNIGVRYAIADKFPCLILHDIDLLPLDESNLYACLDQPRHMSASIDKFRYLLTYDFLVGGVLAIKTEQYVAINGFSNRFQGWGGEDDDLANRILNNNLKILRFPREMSSYTMLVHKSEPKNPNREVIMQENQHLDGKEGYNTVHYENVIYRPNRLFTLIGVKL